MKKRIACATAVAIAATTLVPGTAQAANTRLTISWQAGTALDGDVKSGKVACQKNRKVNVYQELAGQDSKRATAVSIDGGYWYTDAHTYPDDVAPGDRYYAKVKPKRGCSGDKSRVIEYVD